MYKALFSGLAAQLDAAGLVMHGMMLVQDGQTVMEGYWKPFGADSMHRMYSMTKSVTSLAIGLLVDEGRIRLEDPVHQYFPDKLPENPHPYTLQATIRDLLRMSTQNSATSYTVRDTDWVKTFFHAAPSHAPGTLFQYDTAGTTVLATLVERLSGETLLDYLRPRLLDPIGFSKDARCVKTPEGHMWGGSGLICRLRDMARIGQLCLQGGTWEGKQLISADYIREATSRQIDNAETGYCGYGYQFWCLPEGFQLYGMGSQYVFCYPEKNAVFACVADTQLAGPRAGALVNCLVEAVYHALPQTVPADAAPVILDNLSIQPVQGPVHAACADRIDGKQYKLKGNPMHIEAVKLSFSGDQGTFAYTKKGQPMTICFGLGHLLPGVFPEIYFGERIGTPSASGYQILASAAWVEPEVLRIFVHVVDDYLGALSITVAYKGSDIAIHMSKAAEWFLGDYQGFAGGSAE